MAKKMGVTMEVGNDGVTVITISNPPVNSLASPIISGLKEKFQDANHRSDVKAIVLTGNGGRFSGGFDINVFQQVHKTGDISLMPEVSIDLVCNLMEGIELSYGFLDFFVCLKVNIFLNKIASN
ncbi:hypothetical protein Bca4012_101106 [Brassica carinata]